MCFPLIKISSSKISYTELDDINKEEAHKLEESPLLNYSKKQSSCLMTWSVLRTKVTFF